MQHKLQAVLCCGVALVQDGSNTAGCLTVKSVFQSVNDEMTVETGNRKEETGRKMSSEVVLHSEKGRGFLVQR